MLVGESLGTRGAIGERMNASGVQSSSGGLIRALNRWRGRLMGGEGLRRGLAVARLAVLMLTLPTVPLVPGLDGHRWALFGLLVGVWAPMCALHYWLAGHWQRRGVWAVAAVLDVATVTSLAVVLPQLTQAAVLALVIFAALYSLLDPYRGGLLLTTFGTVSLILLLQWQPESGLAPLDVWVFAVAGLAMTGLIGLVSQAQRSSAMGFATSYARTRDQLELVLRAGDTGLWEWDMAQDRIDWSDTMLAIFGVTAAPTDVASYMQIIHPDDRAMLQSRIEQAMKVGGDYEVQHRIVVDGRVRWIFGKGRVLTDPEGLPVGIQGVATDITRQREQQLQLERSRRLETVSGLAGGFAHDFNNLLAVITMTAEIHRRSELTDEQRERVDFILEATRRGASLSSRLLAFARRESGHPEPLRLGRLIQEIEPMLQQALRADITLTIDVPEGLPAILADRTLLEQALLNLAVNARDAIPASGRVLITARHEQDEEGPGRVRLAVRDDGVGMTEEVRERALEPFFTTKGPDRGTGLGLASVYATVAALGGDVEIDSRLGNGTTVRLVLPATDDRPHGGYQRDGGDTDPEAATVLVVDDDPGVRRALTDLLGSLDHRVIAAGNGVEALRLLDELGHAGIDVVITDVVMPEMCGPELVKQMHLRGIDLPVVYMTGYVDRYENDLPEASRVLHKPFTTDELRACVAHALAPAG